MLGQEITVTEGQKIKCTWQFKKLLLNPGNYFISFWIGQTNVDIDGMPEVLSFEVLEPDNTPYAILYPGKYRCDFDFKLENESI